MLYPFYEIYTKISMIFESVYNFLHNSTNQAFLSKKKKKKNILCYAGGLLGPGPRRPASFPRRTRALPSSPGH
jgi:hypothetical protein